MGLNPAIAARVDAVFAEMDAPGHPGAALLVVDHDEVVLSRCYGLADLEAGRPITTDTSFCLASISKQFTAMAIMLLAEEGRLDYDDRLPAYFPDFPAWGADISLRHLLHHTAGLPDYFPFFTTSDDIPEFTRATEGITNEAVLDRAMGLAGPAFPPGSKYAYGGTGYILLAMIVAAVSGRSIGDFLKDRVFDPLGMAHTVAYDESRPALHRPAHGYWNDDGRFRRWDYPLRTVGDGGLFSTLDDLFLWDQALNTECLVPRAALERAFTSGTTDDGTPVGYGFGWITDVFPYLRDVERDQLIALGGAGLRHVAHGGSCVAYFNYMIRFLDTRRTIVLLTNHQGGLSPRILAHEVAAIVFGDRAGYRPPERPRAVVVARI